MLLGEENTPSRPSRSTSCFSDFFRQNHPCALWGYTVIQYSYSPHTLPRPERNETNTFSWRAICEGYISFEWWGVWRGKELDGLAVPSSPAAFLQQASCHLLAQLLKWQRCKCWAPPAAVWMSLSKKNQDTLTGHSWSLAVERPDLFLKSHVSTQHSAPNFVPLLPSWPDWTIPVLLQCCGCVPQQSARLGRSSRQVPSLAAPWASTLSPSKSNFESDIVWHWVFQNMFGKTNAGHLLLPRKLLRPPRTAWQTCWGKRGSWNTGIHGSTDTKFNITCVYNIYIYIYIHMGKNL